MLLTKILHIKEFKYFFSKKELSMLPHDSLNISLNQILIDLNDFFHVEFLAYYALENE